MEFDWLAQKCALFAGVPGAQVGALCRCLGGTCRRYRRGEVLLLAGYENRSIGIVLRGRIEAVKTFADGRQLCMAQMGPGGVFGDVMAASHKVKSPVTVLAQQNCEAMWLPYEALLAPPQGADGAQHALRVRVLRNLVELMSVKYFQLDQRVELLMLRRVRDKVLWYVRSLPAGADGWRVTPYARGPLAEYLGCERSALCRELTNMRRDGVLQAEGRRFRLAADAPDGQAPVCEKER